MDDDRCEDARIRPVLRAINEAWNALPRDASWGAMLEAMALAAISAVDSTGTKGRAVAMPDPE